MLNAVIDEYVCLSCSSSFFHFIFSISSGKSNWPNCLGQSQLFGPIFVFPQSAIGAAISIGLCQSALIPHHGPIEFSMPPLGCQRAKNKLDCRIIVGGKMAKLLELLELMMRRRNWQHFVEPVGLEWSAMSVV
jgi:hypothetical protein